jgi:hypothetical protein
MKDALQQKQSRSRHTAVLASVLALIACASDARLPNADSVVVPRVPAAWQFDAPARWDDRVRIDHEPALPGDVRSRRAFTYVPSDTTAHAETLLSIAIYDTASWRAEGARGTGDTLATDGSQVFVASFPSANPYAAGSRDAQAFDSLIITLAEARRSFRVVR